MSARRLGWLPLSIGLAAFGSSVLVQSQAPKPRTSKTIVANGDHDVFGDGSVVLLSTPGHSPGHQSLFVKRAKTGPIVVSGDRYRYPAERTFNKLPKADKAEQTTASRVKLEAYLKKTSAQLWIQHDLLAYRLF